MRKKISQYKNLQQQLQKNNRTIERKLLLQQNILNCRQNEFVIQLNKTFVSKKYDFEHVEWRSQ